MKEEKYWAVVPAAGVGRRMRSNVPKQYLQLLGETVLLRTLRRLASCPGISGVFVGISATDEYWQEMAFSSPWLKSVCEGGVERSDTVYRILDDMSSYVADSDWILVHDAVRPCVQHEEILHLMKQATKREGGLLALPITDTIKRANKSDEVEETVSRDNLWRALTPQMFRYGDLKRALADAREKGWVVTDEASAMEHAGYAPLLVQGRAENIKITLPGDLQIAENYIRLQEQE